MNSLSVNKPIRLFLLSNKKNKPDIDEVFSSIEMAKIFLGTVESEYNGGFITDQGVTLHSFTCVQDTKH